MSKNSILTLSSQGQHQIPQLEGSVPQDHPPLQIPITSPGCYLCFWQTGCKSEVLTTHSLSSVNLLEQLTKPRKPIYLLDYQFITKDIKGYESTHIYTDTQDEFPPKNELLCLWSWGPSTVAQGSFLVPQPGNSLNLLLLSIYGTFIT